MTIQQPKRPHRPRITDDWERLALADGSILFVSVYGEHFRLAAPSPRVRALLAQLDGARTLPELLATFRPPLSDRERASLERLLVKLHAAGIVGDVRSTERPSWVTEELFQRFHLELGFFARYATAERDEFELFGRLQRAHVVIIGAGGGGGHCAMYLAAAGVGRLSLVDGDSVEPTNLVRQIHYDLQDVGRPKALALAERIRRFTTFTRVDPVEQYIVSREHAVALLGELAPDFVLPCADSPRLLFHRWIAAACVELGLPSMPAFNGVVGPIYIPGKTPCYGCLEAVFRARANGTWDMMVDAVQREPPRRYPSFVTGPVIGAVAQVMDCIGHLTRAWEPASMGTILQMGRLGVCGAEAISADGACPICSERARGRSASAAWEA